MSSEETNVKDAPAAQKKRRPRHRFSEEIYDEITAWELSEKKRKRAEANRRYRERQKLLKPATSRAKTPAEYNRIYRERKKLRQAQAAAEAAAGGAVFSVSWKIPKVEDDPESDRYIAEVSYQQFLPTQNAINPQETSASEINIEPSPQNAINPQETSASEINIEPSPQNAINSQGTTASEINMANIQEIQEIQDDTDDSNAPLRRRQIRRSYSSENNFDEQQEDSDEYIPSTENQSDSDSVSTSDVVPTTEEFANMSPAKKAAEAAKRHRLITKMLNSNKPSPLTASERSRAYRERQKSLQHHAEKILTRASKTNFNETEEVNYDANKNERRPKAPPKTAAQKSKEYRERKSRMIMAAFGGITTKNQQIGNMKDTTSSDNNEDDKESSYSGSKKQLRYVLTMDERVAVISQFDTERKYAKLALIFNCTEEQIKSVVSNRNAILEFNETTIILSKQAKEPSELRRRKLNLFGYCLYEYTQRAQYHFNAHITEELLLQRAIEFRDLMGIDGFTPDKIWINQFMAAYNVNSSKSSINITQRPRISLDLGNIMSHCVRHSAMASNLQPKIPETVKLNRKTSGQNQGTSGELESEDDVGSLVIDTDYNDDLNNSPRTSLTEELADNFQQSSLKIEKLNHSPLHIADYQVVDVDMPEITTAPSLCDNSEASEEAPLPRCVESFKDALRLLKPLEDFALMRENYRVIGLVSQLEQIFEAGKKAEERLGSSIK